jgi:hypothetical protein
MKNSTLFLICMAFLATVVALASYASAQCAACEKEGDWSQSASNFIEGKPTSEEPAEFGPKAVRKTASQFENKTKATEETTDSDANAAAVSAASSAAQAPTVELVLRSINASPAQVNSANVVKITAVFALNGSLQSENQTEMQLTATSSIKDSNGKEVEKLNLIKTSGNEYSNDWLASVPAGIYIVDIAASYLQGSASFNDALQIEVVGSANATQAAPTAQNLG